MKNSNTSISTATPTHVTTPPPSHKCTPPMHVCVEGWGWMDGCVGVYILIFHVVKLFASHSCPSSWSQHVSRNGLRMFRSVQEFGCSLHKMNVKMWRCVFATDRDHESSFSINHQFSIVFVDVSVCEFGCVCTSWLCSIYECVIRPSSVQCRLIIFFVLLPFESFEPQYQYFGVEFLLRGNVDVEIAIHRDNENGRMNI